MKMLKQYVFVPKNMPTGKACSQVAHATFLALQKTQQVGEPVINKLGNIIYHNLPNLKLIKDWQETGMCLTVS